MIPSFPTFHKLKLSHREGVSLIVKKFLPYSDFNFTSLWTYNINNSIEISILNDNLIVRFIDYLHLKPFYSFIGQKKIAETIDVLFEHAEKNGLESYLKLVPEAVINEQQLMPEKYLVEEDLDNHDYIILAEEVAILHPEKYRRKLHLVEQFKKKYSGYQIKLVDLKNDYHQKEIVDLFVLWEKINTKDRKESNNEFLAIKRLIKSVKKIDVFTLCIYFENKLIGFNIYELTHESYAISAFQKGDKAYTGIYAMLNYEVAKHLVTMGCRYINLEQDLGIEGLRLSKSTWKPTHFLKKYIITPKK